MAAGGRGLVTMAERPLDRMEEAGPGGVDTPDELTRLRAIEVALAQAASHSPIVIYAQDRDLRYVWLHNINADPVRQSMVGKFDHEMLTPETAAPLTALKRRVLTTGAPAREAVRIHVLGEAEPRFYDLTLVPTRDAAGAIIGITGVGINVTVQERQRAELEAARAEAERANQAKSRFLAAASHDLRQPFQAMHLFLHLLEMKLTADDQRDLARKLGEALESGEQLLNTLLEISALESGTVTPSPEDVPLGRLLRRLTEEFEPQAAEKGLRLRFVDSSATVRTDPVMLDRMLRNLIGNALRHTATGKVLLGARNVDGAMRIEVWDTGPGIPEDKRQEIFQEFIQLNEGPRDRRQGLGLGLSIVKRTGQLLGHPVGLRSRPGHGSCFWIEVPVPNRPARTAAPARPEPVLPPAPRPLVAVAEDDRLQLAALEAMLRDWGCEAVLAPTAAELLAKLRTLDRAPDILLTDLRLPGTEQGPTLASEIRAAYGDAVPALLLTGDTHPEIETTAREARLTLVHKPVHPNRLRRTIEAALGLSLRRNG